MLNIPIARIECQFDFSCFIFDNLEGIIFEGTMSYEDALALMQEYTKSDALRKHMFAVETALRAYAKKYNEDETVWAITGLLHDFDYERHPNPPDGFGRICPVHTILDRRRETHRHDGFQSWQGNPHGNRGLQT